MFTATKPGRAPPLLTVRGKRLRLRLQHMTDADWDLLVERLHADLIRVCTLTADMPLVVLRQGEYRRAVLSGRGSEPVA